MHKRVAQTSFGSSERDASMLRAKMRHYEMDSQKDFFGSRIFFSVRKFKGKKRILYVFPVLCRSTDSPGIWPWKNACFFPFPIAICKCQPCNDSKAWTNRKKENVFEVDQDGTMYNVWRFNCLDLTNASLYLYLKKENVSLPTCKVMPSIRFRLTLTFHSSLRYFQGATKKLQMARQRFVGNVTSCRER